MEQTKKDTCEVICDFGDDFGMLTKENISTLFADIHSTVSPLDPFNKMAMDHTIKEVN